MVTAIVQTILILNGWNHAGLIPSGQRFFSDYLFNIGLLRGDFRIFCHIGNKTCNLAIVVVDNSRDIR